MREWLVRHASFFLNYRGAEARVVFEVGLGMRRSDTGKRIAAKLLHGEQCLSSFAVRRTDDNLFTYQTTPKESHGNSDSRQTGARDCGDFHLDALRAGILEQFYGQKISWRWPVEFSNE
jgi:hypothetical protein